jgi:hypothetical protein
MYHVLKYGLEITYFSRIVENVFTAHCPGPGLAPPHPEIRTWEGDAKVAARLLAPAATDKHDELFAPCLAST